MKITWLGHSCFKIQKDGFTVILDPYQDGSVPGLKNIRETADLVICSHGHGDHSGRECVTLTGRTESPLTITQIETFHDDVQGRKRGNNKITVLDDGKTRIAHLGDLGCPLTEEQEKMLKNLDLALIPVGGFYTIDGRMAADLVNKIRPRKAVPMHYRDPELGFGFDVIRTAEEFLELTDSKNLLKRSDMDTEKDYGAQVIVLTPRQAEKSLMNSLH